MTSPVRDIDKGYRSILSVMRDLDGLQMTAGVPASAGEDVVTYGAANEFGTDTIPERSYLRSTLDANRAKYAKMAAKALKQAMGGKPIIVAAQRVADEMAQDVKRTILSGVSPALDAATIKAKGSSQTLIDSGKLLNSITGTVSTKRGG